MKKTFLTLAVMLVAFGSTQLFAQRNERLAQAKKIAKQRLQNSDDDLALPLVATFTHDGHSMKTDYTHDEYENTLLEELTQIHVGGNWQNRWRTTYEYGWVGLDEKLVQTWSNNDWVDTIRQSYTYDQNNEILAESIIQTSTDGINWTNKEKQVYNHGDNVTILYSEWENNMWKVKDLYTITVMNDRIEILVQYMQGGAWQNEKKISQYLLGDDLDNFDYVTYEYWENDTWNNEKKETYQYENGMFTSINVEEWENNAWLLEGRASYTYENGNAIHGQYQKHEANTWIDADYDLLMTYNDNCDVLELEASEVNLTYNIILNTAENNAAARFGVYPNPTKDFVTISGKGFERAEVYNMAGQKMMETNRSTINLKSLNAGSYLIKVIGNGTSDTHKIVLE